jgi:uncharacterized protein (DUF1684 family)
MAAADTLALLDWKRREPAWELWRETRDELFRSHSQSPLPAAGRGAFEGLDYWPYDPEARVLAELEDVDAPPEAIESSGPEPILFKPFARAHFELRGEPLVLEVDWLEGYGSGAFLSFRDATSGRETYGGGRYVLDTVKGADLGEEDGKLVLDFNFAYNPSCSYDPSWVCPLAPPANRLAIPIEAGELHAA